MVSIKFYLQTIQRKVHELSIDPKIPPRESLTDIYNLLSVLFTMLGHQDDYNVNIAKRLDELEKN